MSSWSDDPQHVESLERLVAEKHAESVKRWTMDDWLALVMLAGALLVGALVGWIARGGLW